MNRLLKRQIKRHLGGLENVPDSMLPFLEAIDRSYQHYEEDRLLLERSMDISSNELESSNIQLSEESKKQAEILNRLKESLNTLLSVDDSDSNINFIDDEDDILKVIDFIEIQSKHIKQVEEEILQVQHFINQSNDAIQVMDTDGGLVFANHNALQWMGSERGNHFTKKIFEIDSKFENEGEWKDILEKLKTEKSFITEKDQNTDGFDFPVEIGIKQVKLNNDHFVICVSRDISSRKESENLQQELIKGLKKANEELENFAYIVSHDLKAPVRGIGSLTSWLIEDYSELLDDEGKNLLSLMKKRVLRMQQLIEGILQYSRVGRLDGEEKEINLNTIVKDVIDTIAPPKDTFEIVFDNELPTIVNSEIRISQVFQNLISNAIKYNDKDRCIVSVGVRNLEDTWEFYVQDNGPGIKPAYHNKIFKIFQTLQARDKFESTGIGLSIIKKIIEQNDGTIRLESDEGKGCRFLFTLPK